MAIKKWSPFNEMNRFFDDVLDYLPTRMGFDLAVDLYREGNDLVAEMSVPGIDIKNTEVDVIDDLLKVSGHREEKIEKKEKSFFHREIHRGSFERSIRLPVPVVASKTKATYKDGVLKVVMPLKETADRQKIEIKAD